MVSVKTLTAALAALVVSGGVAAAAVATADLNLRAKPGTQGQVIGTIPAGTSVATLGCQDGWCKVNYAGNIGFASASYLSGEDRGAAVLVPGVPMVRTPYDSYAYEDNGPSVGFGFSFGDRGWRW